MKSIAIARFLLITIGAGVSFAASAAESGNEAPVTPVKETDDAARQAAWERKEAALLKVLKEVVVAQAAAWKDDSTTDWSAVETNVKRYIFVEVSDKGDVIWPDSQFAWVHDARSKLQREERREKGRFTFERELETLGALEKRLGKEVESAKGPATTEVDKASDTGADEPRWKFRDKSGSRTTRPRYKGQEPVN